MLVAQEPLNNIFLTPLFGNFTALIRRIRHNPLTTVFNLVVNLTALNCSLSLLLCLMLTLLQINKFILHYLPDLLSTDRQFAFYQK